MGVGGTLRETTVDQCRLWATDVMYLSAALWAHKTRGQLALHISWIEWVFFTSTFHLPAHVLTLSWTFYKGAYPLEKCVRIKSTCFNRNIWWNTYPIRHKQPLVLIYQVNFKQHAILISDLLQRREMKDPQVLQLQSSNAIHSSIPIFESCERLLVHYLSLPANVKWVPAPCEDFTTTCAHAWVKNVSLR